jgi:hypothetical protein
VTLPLSLVLVDYYFDRKLSMKLIYEKWHYFLLSFITGIAGIFFLKTDGSLAKINDHFTFFEKHLPASFAYLVYWVKSAVPYRMLPLYPYPEDISWIFYVSQMLVFSLWGVTYYFFRKKKKVLVFGILFFTLNIKPLLQVLSAGQAFLADRFTYLPYFGLFLIYACGIQWVLHKHQRFNKLVYVAIFLVLGGYGYINIEPLHDLNKYIALYPIDHHVFIVRGITYAQLHNYENALLDLKMAEELDSSHADIYRNRAVIHFRLGEFEKSQWELEKYLRLKPDDKEMWSIFASLKMLEINSLK